MQNWAPISAGWRSVVTLLVGTLVFNACPLVSLFAGTTSLVRPKAVREAPAALQALEHELHVPDSLNPEPQFSQENLYGAALRNLLYGPRVTQASIQRRQILSTIGPAAERAVQALYGDDLNVKIAIVPYGSTLKGYADDKSDLEYTVYILSGREGGSALERGVQRIHIHEAINELIDRAGVHAEPMIVVLPVMNLSGLDQEAVSGSLLDEQLDAWNLMHLFLPAVYGDAVRIEQSRKHVIAHFGSRGREGEQTWQALRRLYAEYVAIRQGDVDLKPHLRDWLQRQGVASLEAFNRTRAVGLPDLGEMARIYDVSVKSSAVPLAAAPTTWEETARMLERSLQSLLFSPVRLNVVVEHETNHLKLRHDFPELPNLLDEPLAWVLTLEKLLTLERELVRNEWEELLHQLGPEELLSQSTSLRQFSKVQQVPQLVSIALRVIQDQYAESSPQLVDAIRAAGHEHLQKEVIRILIHEGYQSYVHPFRRTSEPTTPPTIPPPTSGTPPTAGGSIPPSTSTMPTPSSGTSVIETASTVLTIDPLIDALGNVRRSP